MSTNKTIAKNTLFLYFRMMLVMAVSLYTSRIVLKELGVSDYGIYTLVGGVVAMFGFLNGAMVSSTLRYLSFNIGKNDELQLKQTFSAIVLIHIIIATLVLILAETIGLWYINNKMIFPLDRLYAVHIVFQFSIAAAILEIIQVPYNALIIAHEKMKIYAYVSIAEAILKLVIVFLLVFFGNDKLITYSILVFIVTLLIRVFYQIYCRNNFKESHFHFYWDKHFYKEIVSFSGWNLFGALSRTAREQGSNVVLNLFFGTIANAAFGVASAVSGAVNAFVPAFQLASEPQIIKLHAKGEKYQMEVLLNRTLRFSFYLSFFIIVPVFFNIDFLLQLWLVHPPKYANTFIQILLVFSLINVFSNPMNASILATGNNRNYQLAIGILGIITIPIAYLLLKLEITQYPEIILFTWIFSALAIFISRLYFLKTLIDYSLSLFLKDVIIPIFLISLLSVGTVYIIRHFIPPHNFFNFSIQALILCGIMLGLIYSLGLKNNEREIIIKFIKKYLNKIC